MDRYLNESQQILFKNWQKRIGSKYLGAIGGQFGLKIIFTGLGEVIIGFDNEGNEINLTEYDKF